MKRSCPKRAIWFVALLLPVTACSDRVPSEPRTAPGIAAIPLACQANVRAGTLSCADAGNASVTPSGSPRSANVILGGQGIDVKLTSSNVRYDSTTAIFQADVTVQNLTTQTLGTPDGSTVTGVTVFFSSGPSVTSGSGAVSVTNADGLGTFTGTDQPFFLYNEMVPPGAVSAARTWQWSVPSTVGAFVFTVLVDAATTGPQFGHVFVVTEENHGYSSVIGDSSMPYLNGLALQYGLATQYYANTHPSIGNYFELATGQIISNSDDDSTIVNVDNIVRQLVAAGKSWKSYAEGLPAVGFTGDSSGEYVRKHNVFALLSDVVDDPVQVNSLVPFTQFATDLATGTLPAFSNIVPNLCDDAHSCSLATADAWLQANIDPLIKSPTFQQDGLLIVVFDEASVSDTTHGGGRVAWVAVSPKSKPSYQSTTLYQHQSTLRLILRGLGVHQYPGDASTAPDMDEFFPR